MQKNKNPIWDYKYNHDIYIVKDITKKVLTLSVYGKYSPEDYEDLYREFGFNFKQKVAIPPAPKKGLS